jgi:hypothetical protein
MLRRQSYKAPTSIRFSADRHRMLEELCRLLGMNKRELIEALILQEWTAHKRLRRVS